MVKSLVLLGLTASALAATANQVTVVGIAATTSRSVWVRSGTAVPYTTGVIRTDATNGATGTGVVVFGTATAAAAGGTVPGPAGATVSGVGINDVTITSTGFTGTQIAAKSAGFGIAGTGGVDFTLADGTAATDPIGYAFIDGSNLANGVIVSYTFTAQTTVPTVYTGTISNQAATGTALPATGPAAFSSNQGYVAIPFLTAAPFTLNFTNGTVAFINQFGADPIALSTGAVAVNTTFVQGTVGPAFQTAVISPFAVLPVPPVPVPVVVVPVPVTPNVTIECAVAGGLSPVLFCSDVVNAANPCIGGANAARLSSTVVLCVPPNAQLSPFEVRAILAVIAAGDRPRTGFQSFIAALVASDIGIYAANVTTNPVAEGYFQEQGFATYAAPSAVNPAAARVLVAIPALGVQLIICTQVLPENQIACLRRGLREVRALTGVDTFAANGICAVDGILVSCDLTSSSSKKGLLGLLGLLGLIPLLLSLSLCCLLCLCRRKKVENEVAFATFDPAVAPVSTFVAPVSATCTGFGAPLGSGIPVTIA